MWRKRRKGKRKGNKRKKGEMRKEKSRGREGPAKFGNKSTTCIGYNKSTKAEYINLHVTISCVHEKNK